MLIAIGGATDVADANKAGHRNDCFQRMTLLGEGRQPFEGFDSLEIGMGQPGFFDQAIDQHRPKSRQI